MTRHALVDDHPHDDAVEDPIRSAVNAVRDEFTAVRQEASDRDEGARARAEQTVDRRARRYWLPRIALASAGAAAFAVVVVLALLGPQLTELRNADSDLIAESQEIRDLVTGAADAGNAANNELAARGLPQVPIATPGSAPDSDVLVDAATAQVLAALPPAAAAQPSAADLGRAVAGYFAANPVTPTGPSAAALSQAVADFLAANPIPIPENGQDGGQGETGGEGPAGDQGPQGDQSPEGPRGPPPTAEEIQAALGAFLAENPNTLCPRGGTFALVEGAVTLDGPQDFWVCVLPSTPPVDPVDPDPTVEPPQPDDGLLDGLVD